MFLLIVIMVNEQPCSFYKPTKFETIKNAILVSVPSEKGENLINEDVTKVCFSSNVRKL
jgi:hypothetical protein